LHSLNIVYKKRCGSVVVHLYSQCCIVIVDFQRWHLGNLSLSMVRQVTHYIESGSVAYFQLIEV